MPFAARGTTVAGVKGVLLAPVHSSDSILAKLRGNSATGPHPWTAGLPEVKAMVAGSDQGGPDISRSAFE